MKKASSILILFLLLMLTGPTSSHAQDNVIKFEHLNVEDGLPSNVVYDVIQDEQGFIWFATKNGLAKYDGYEFTVYNHDPNDSNSLDNNYVWNILKDHNGILWATTAVGINKFDPISETFTRYHPDENNPNSLTVSTIYEDKTGIIWIGTDEGTFIRFDPTHETFVYYQFDILVTSVEQDNDGQLWLGSYGDGVHKFDPETEKLIPYQHDENNPNSLSNDFVLMIEFDKKGMLWVATRTGLDSYNPHSDQFTHYNHDEKNPNSLSTGEVNVIYEDSIGRLWIGTITGGLNQFDRLNNNFIHYPNSLSSNIIWKINEDSTGILWITTENGVYKYDSDSNHFSSYHHNNQIGAIYEDEHGTVWLGTYNDGLHKFDRQTGTFIHYPQSPSYIRAIHPDRTGDLWLGTTNGLYRFDPVNETFVEYPSNDLNGSISGLDVDSAGKLWIVYFVDGLAYFDPTDNSMVRYEVNKNSLNIFMTVVKIASSGLVWIGTDYKGVSQFNPKDNSFTHYLPDETPHSLSNFTVNTIFEDSRGRIWIGTNHGLNRFNQTNQNFTTYLIEHGLAGNVVAAILEDNQGYLWVSTDKGLSRFDTDAERFHNYNRHDGLQSDQFLPHSAYKSQTGELFFGGVNGLNAFYPDQLVSNRHVPPVVLTDFQIFNQSVPIGVDDSPLTEHINVAKKITLSPEQLVFSFEFTALSYSVPEKNQYAYYMEGVDRDWVFVDSNQRFATYTHLGPGEYKFSVKGSNNDGLWNEEGTTITITILPQWWETIWFRMGVVVVTITLIFGGVRWRLYSIEQRTYQLEEAVSKRTAELYEAKEKAEVANKVKMSFIANMSHELRTPLNIILGHVQLLGNKNVDPKHESSLAAIQQSGHHLLTLINDVLDISRIERDKIELVPNQFDLAKLLQSMVEIFRPEAEAKNLVFRLNMSPHSSISVQADEKRLRQILINLLGNALKFTPQGEVKLTVTGTVISKFAEESGTFRAEKSRTTGANSSSEQTSFFFEVSDTGIGIAADNLAKLFTPFEQVGSLMNQHGGTGLGLAISYQLVKLMGGELQVETELGQGSRFFFEIPLELLPESSSIDRTSLPDISKFIEESGRFQAEESRTTGDSSKDEPMLIPPPEIIEHLLDSARQGKILVLQQKLHDLVEQEPQYQPFVEKINRFIKKYQVQNLCDWLEMIQ